MRIGFFTDTYTPQINGVVTSICLFKKALEERGHDVYVFAPTPQHPDDGSDTFRFPSIPFVFQPEMRLASPVSLEALRVLDEAQLDVIHSHDPFSIGMYGLTYARRKRLPYIHTYHTLYPEYVHYVWETRLTRRVAERLSREFCDMCTSVVAPSTKIERHLRDWGVTVPIEVIATGVDIERFAQPDPDRLSLLAQSAGVRPDETVLLYMGRLGREKNVELLIRALWHTRHTDVRLIVAGDGPSRGELESLAAQLELEDRVSFVGYLDRADVVAAYHLAHAFVFGSTSETQGLVIGEAMAAGLPVIAVEDHAVEDFVESERTGIIVPGRPEDMARAIDRMAADADLRTEFARASRERATRFSIEHQAERLEGHYEQALSTFQPKRRRTRLALPRRKNDA